MADYTTPNGAIIDWYYNNYDPARHYETLLLRDGRPMMASEMNEMQSIELARHKKLANALFKDGDVVAGAQIQVDKESGFVTATAGQIALDGMIWDLAQARFQIPVKGTVAVGARLVETVISEMEDPTLRNPAVGTDSEGEAGAWRLKLEAVWGYDGDGGAGRFFPVYMVDDGSLRAKEAPPSLDLFNVAIARYDRDSTGGGTYVCNGLAVTSQASGDSQTLFVAAGRAQVSGESVELLASYPVKFTATPDLRLIDTEVHTADGKASQRITVAHPPVREYVNLREGFK